MRAVADSVGGDDVGMGELFGLSPKASIGPVGDIEWHRGLLADRHRVHAFRQAVREAVCLPMSSSAPGQGSWHCWQSGLAPLESTP